MLAISSSSVAASSAPAACRPSLRAGRGASRPVRAVVPARASASAGEFASRDGDDKALAAALSDLGFDAAASSHHAAPVAEEPKWWEGAGSRAGSVACLAVAALVVSPGLASAASSRSNGRVGGSNFGSRSTTAYSPAPAQQGFKGTSAAPTKAAETSTATSAAKATAVKNTTVKNTTVNNTTVVKESGPVHHHHTTVIAAPAPCPVSTVVSAAATAAVVSSMHQPMYHQPMVAAAPMVAAPMVAAPVIVHRPFWTPLTIGLTCAGVFGLAAFLVSRNNNKRAEEW